MNAIPDHESLTDAHVDDVSALIELSQRLCEGSAEKQLVLLCRAFGFVAAGMGVAPVDIVRNLQVTMADYRRLEALGIVVRIDHKPN